MKQLLLSSTVFVLFLSACGTAPTEMSASLPVIQVDAAHMINPGLAYEIPAGAGFVLDASSYDFGTSSGPAAVQVVLGGHAYQGNWTSGAVSQSILAAELEPIGGAARLTGFLTGQELIVSIGSLSSKGRFTPMWVAVVDVK